MEMADSWDLGPPVKKLRRSTFDAIDEAESPELTSRPSELLLTDVRSATTSGAAMLSSLAWALGLGPMAIGAMSLVPRPQLVAPPSDFSWAVGTAQAIGLPPGLTQLAQQVEQLQEPNANPAAPRRQTTGLRSPNRERGKPATKASQAEVDGVQPTRPEELPPQLAAPSNLRVQ
jgi:hypothetical protein